MKWISHIGVLLVGFVFGVYFGFDRAPNEFLYWDAQYKASILAHEIEWLKSGRVEPIIESKEIQLNSELANYARHLKSPYGWLIEHSVGVSDTEEAIARAVVYRLKNEYEGTDMSSPLSWKDGVDMESKFIREVIDSQEGNKKLIMHVLESYAPVEPKTN